MIAREMIELRKRAAAERAAECIADGMAVGLGTGSTVRHLLNVIAERRARGEWARLRGVATSADTATRARELGIPVVTLRECPRLEVTIDGADEVDPSLDLTKGLGGALLREKIVASVSYRLVIMADDSKLVRKLGARAPIPVEVDPFAADVLPEFFRELGADPVLRTDSAGSPFRTDGGHFIYDCRFPEGIEEPERVAAALSARPGVIEHGLFLGMASLVVVADADGVRLLHRGEGAAVS